MPVRPSAMSAILMIAVTVAGLTVAETREIDGALHVLQLIAGAAAIAAIPWRYRYPRAFGVVAVLSANVSPLTSYLPLVGVFVVATRRRVSETVLITVLALGGAALNFAAIPDPQTMWAMLLGASTLLVSSVTAGLFTGTRRAMVDDLRERLTRAEVDRALRDEQARIAERRRIAGEMHDRLGHRLSLLSVHAGALALRTDLSAETVRESAQVLRDTTHRAMEDLRTIVQVLHDPPCDESEDTEDLTAVEGLVAEARAAGADVSLRSTALLMVAPPGRPLAGVAYRVVREGLTNAARHSPGAPVEVVLDGRPGRDLTVTVTSGCTGDRPAPEGAGTGLVSLRERVETLTGGTLAHGPLPTGYRLRAALPWRKESA
ncbi:histidine kinase [Pseudonocardia sp. NPDC046786]|uniref:sensor histidine kinase n=1 Tax=Pseudonocardia sp. NPDC046786 TaxID=3155471 RepID=UPI0033E0C777